MGDQSTLFFRYQSTLRPHKFLQAEGNISSGMRWSFGIFPNVTSFVTKLHDSVSFCVWFTLNVTKMTKRRRETLTVKSPRSWTVVGLRPNLWISLLTWQERDSFMCPGEHRRAMPRPRTVSVSKRWLHGWWNILFFSGGVVMMVVWWWCAGTSWTGKQSLSVMASKMMLSCTVSPLTIISFLCTSFIYWPLIR